MQRAGVGLPTIRDERILVGVVLFGVDFDGYFPLVKQDVEAVRADVLVHSDAVATLNQWAGQLALEFAARADWRGVDGFTQPLGDFLHPAEVVVESLFTVFAGVVFFQNSACIFLRSSCRPQGFDNWYAIDFGPGGQATVLNGEGLGLN